MKRDLICIVCPKGCALTAEVVGENVTVTGNACPRGAKYAEDECLHPMRTVTMAVRVANRPQTMIAVKTAAPVPKNRMAEVIAAVRALAVHAPVAIGEVVAHDVCGTELVVTKAAK